MSAAPNFLGRCQLSPHLTLSIKGNGPILLLPLSPSWAPFTLFFLFLFVFLLGKERETDSYSLLSQVSRQDTCSSSSAVRGSLGRRMSRKEGEQFAVSTYHSASPSFIRAPGKHAAFAPELPQSSLLVQSLYWVIPADALSPTGLHKLCP